MPPRRLLVLLYAASGAAALVYEVVWTRLLTLQLGHTVAAASTVLAAFMGGLAIGAWCAGLLLSRRPGVDGLRAYALLEVVIGVGALLLPIALAASVPLLAWAYADAAAPLRFAIVRVALSAMLVGIPAAAMGATFPLATDWLAKRTQVGRPRFADAGALYAANTTGAAAGALAAGFWLIPALGLLGTTWVGVALNVIAAGGAFRLSMTTRDSAAIDEERRAPTPSKKTKKPRPAPRDAAVPPAPGLAGCAAGISGFAALIYEVAWTRLLDMVIGPTTYAFATMAAAFVGGLAIGSAAGTRLGRRTSRPDRWLATALLTGAIAAPASAWFGAARMPLAVAALVADPNASLGPIVIGQAMRVALVLLPMTFALGATFPLALAVASGRAESGSAMADGAGQDAAFVYTANIVGAIAGALAAGFLLIPRFGLNPTFRIAAGVAALTGAAALFVGGPRTAAGAGRARAALPIVVAVLAIALVALMPSWDRRLLASGAYKYAPYLGSGDIDLVLRAGTLEYYKEGAAATVSVRRLAGTRSLSIDGKVDATDAGDMLTQRALGLLPVLIHGAAGDVCVIGLGSGVTVGSALAAGAVRHADVVEISPEVVAASHFFDRENGGALARPEVRLIVGDGRSHLLLTPRRYDVIVSEPSNPWMAGVASLFTREFFEAARARLKPGGLLCQWAHTYDISAADLQSIVRTFASVFPRGTMWLVGEGDLLLIGGDEDIDRRLDGVEAACRRGATAETLATVGVSRDEAAFSLLSLFAGGPAELARYGGGAVVQTDDRLPLEYSAPRGIYGRTVGDNSAAIRALEPALPAAVRSALDRATADAWASRGSMLLKADAYPLAFDAFMRAVASDTRHARALAGLSEAAAGAHREPDEVRWLRETAAREPSNAAARLELSRVVASGGDFDAAVDAATEAVRLAPGDPAAAEQLASIVADAGDADRLSALAEALAARFPGRPEALYYRATAAFLHGRTEDALAAVRPLVAAHPEHARAQNLLGAACATLDQRPCAQAAFEASIRANPRDTSTYVNFATFWLRSGNADAAARYFAEALTIDPRQQAAKDGLAQARAQLGDPR